MVAPDNFVIVGIKFMQGSLDRSRNSLFPSPLKVLVEVWTAVVRTEVVQRIRYLTCNVISVKREGHRVRACQSGPRKYFYGQAFKRIKESGTERYNRSGWKSKARLLRPGVVLPTKRYARVTPGQLRCD